MDDTRPNGHRGADLVRSDIGRAGVGPSRPVGGAGVARPGRPAPHRDRIPTLRQLAGLMVNGILMLPRNYRRGMFLDMLV